ncbi:acyl carrier protein [Myxococcota bacterium]|nr:acyl carrier protein [Myxococcota bacterium]MBU1381835.1 acyl carrier protein [Myxococcota bacterium]
MDEGIKEKFLEFITRNFMVEIDEIPLDESLIDEGIIDSFGLIEIASFIEKEFGIIVKEEQMTRSNFGSVHLIVDFIKGATS